VLRHCLLSLFVLLLLTTTSRAATTADPYTIYAILSLTGPAAYLGQQEAAALQVYEGVVNKTGGIKGRPVHFEVMDNQSQVQQAVQLFSEIAAKQVPVVLGPSLGPECSALAPLAIKGPVMYCFSPSFSSVSGSFSFAAGPYITHSMHVLLKYAHDQGTKRLATIILNDATGGLFERLLPAALAQPDLKGMQLVDTEHSDASALTIDAQIARLKEAELDFIYVNSSGAAFQTVLRGMANAGLRTPIITSSANMDLKLLAPFNSTLPVQVAFPSPPSWALEVSQAGALAAVLKQYRGAYESAAAPMTPNDDYAWDPASIVVNSLRKLGTAAASAELRDAILHTRGFAGIGGIYDFTDRNTHGIADNGVMVVAYDAQHQKFLAVSKTGGTPLKTSPRVVSSK
jgi:branched-chain amino acid transport system substrate-binding protein